MTTTEDPKTPRDASVDGVDEWRRDLYDASPERRGELFSTISGIENEPLYAAGSVDVDYARDLGYPGVYPYTRGVYPSMYRGRLWTMRQFAGFGTAEETNERFRYLLEHGQTGLSTAFDMPTLMGYDSDHPRSLGEVGREGVAVDSLDDMETLFAGIPLGDGVDLDDDQRARRDAARVLRRASARSRACRVASLRGTVQTDILKEYIAQKEWVFPPEPSMRLVVDMIEWCSREMPLHAPRVDLAGTTSARQDRPPRRSSRSRSPTASRTSTRASRAAWTSTSSLRGCRSSSTRTSTSSRRSRSTAPRAGSGRRSCARSTARRIRVRWLMRFHTQTAGVSLTAQQPEVNIIRTAIEALAAVLGGTQSLHTNSFDEALALPTENAVRLALRTQQVIAHETGVVNTIDPLGGSYYVEHLTNELERAGLRVLRPDRASSAA